MTAMLLWHDDVRPAPWGWTLARTNDEAISYLTAGGVEAISMDHDLGATPEQIEAHGLGACGQGEETGVHLARWMVANYKVPAIVGVHSWNPAGAEAILRAFADYSRPVKLYRVTYCPQYVAACESEAGFRIKEALARCAKPHAA